MWWIPGNVDAYNVWWMLMRWFNEFQNSSWFDAEIWICFVETSVFVLLKNSDVDSSWTCECTCTEEDVFKVMDCTTRWSRELTTLVTLTPCFVRRFQFFPIIIHSRVAYCFDLLQGTLFIFFFLEKEYDSSKYNFFHTFSPVRCAIFWLETTCALFPGAPRHDLSRMSLDL